MSTSSFDRHW